MSVYQVSPERVGVLLAVHREGGVIAAADSLKISPSAVSQTISKLEKETGLTVLERAPHGAVVTPAGRILVELAEQIEADVTEASAWLRQASGHLTGTVTIGAFHTVIRSILLPFIRAFSVDNPGIDVRIYEVEERVGTAALRAGKIDMLVLERDSGATRPPKGYIDAPFFDEPWVVVTPSAVAKPNKMADLAKLKWLTAQPENAAYHAMRRIIDSVDSSGMAHHAFADYSVALAMVQDGLGAAVLPQLALAGTVSEGVEVTRIPGLGVRRLLLRYRNRDFEKEPSVRRVVEMLREWTRIEGEGLVRSITES